MSKLVCLYCIVSLMLDEDVDFESGFSGRVRRQAFVEVGNHIVRRLGYISLSLSLLTRGEHCSYAVHFESVQGTLNWFDMGDGCGS